MTRFGYTLMTERRSLDTAGPVTWQGAHCRIDSAHLRDVPEGGVPLGIAASDPKSILRFALISDHLIATTQPNREVMDSWHQDRFLAEAAGPLLEKLRAL